VAKRFFSPELYTIAVEASGLAVVEQGDATAPGSWASSPASVAQGRPGSRLVSAAPASPAPLRALAFRYRGGPAGWPWRSPHPWPSWIRSIHLRQGNPAPGSSLRPPPRRSSVRLSAVAGAANDLWCSRLLQESAGAAGRRLSWRGLAIPLRAQQDRAEICSAGRCGAAALQQPFSGSHVAAHLHRPTRMAVADRFHRECQRCRRNLCRSLT